MTKPNRPVAPDAAADAATAEAPQSIKVETNDAVQSIGSAPVESVIDDSHPAGIVIETFVGLQQGVAWAEPAAAEAPAAE